MTIRDIAVAFGYEVDERSVSHAENTIKNIKGMATKLLGAIGIGFSIAGMASLAEAAADAEALKSQFSQTFGEMEAEAADRLDQISKDTGILVNRMKGSFSQITAFAKTTGMETSDALELANRAMAAVADSSAYYDRSLEDVTDSLQSFLKGNFENDSALGLSCTETTRNIAANKLYGKSFKDLAESEKQLTLLKMVEDANKASGALGQAARESDTWTNQLGNLKQSVQDLKAAAGAGFLKPAVAVLKLLSSMVQSATKGVQKITGEAGIMTRGFDSLFALVKKLKPSIDRMMQTLSAGASKGITMIKGIVDKLGGADKALKLLAIVAAAFVIALNWEKIIGGASAFLSLIKKMGSMFSAANLKVLAVTALIVLLALVVEDFINFLMGNDSVIGTLFDKAGIGADNARAAILDAWEKVAGFLTDTWDWIRTTAEEIFGAVKKAITDHMDSMKESLSGIWAGIETTLSVVWDNISGLAELVFGDLLSFFDGWELDLEGVFDAVVSAVDAVLKVFGDVGNWISEHKAAMDVLVTVLGSIAAAFGIVQAAIAAYNVITGICAAASAVLAGGFSLVSVAGGILAGVIAFITSPVTIAVAAIAALIAVGVLLYKNWETIKEYAEAIWNGILSFLTGIIGGIDSKVSEIKDSIVDGIQSAVDWIMQLPSEALQWGADIIGGIADGIKGAIGKVGEAAKGIADKIKSFLHFSVPDEGPLTDYESWMPDFMSGLAEGIGSSEGILLDKVKGVASSISAIMKGATANAATAANGAVSNTSNNTNVTQNNTFNNSYSGGDVQVQKNVSKGMNKSAKDATEYLAKGLAYAR